MKGVIEALVFAGFSTALHLAVAATWDVPPGSEAGAGASGDAVLTLAAAPPALSARVRDWKTAPAVRPVAPDRVVPDPESPAAVAPLPSTLPAAKAAPVSTPPPASAIAPRAEVPAFVQPAAPKPPPPKVADHTPETPSDPAQLRKAETARGTASASGKVAGSTQPRQAASQSVSRAQLADWGAQIRARIERRKKNPRGSWEPSSATLRIEVTRDGGLAGLGVLKSSGDSRLDRAALDAVKRAGPFPSAPSGFAKSSMTFDLPVSFVR